MDFRKLPSNSEGLLLKLVCSENPTQVLREQYNGLSTQQEQELDGIIRELKGLGYIDVKWADNEPYFVILNNSATTDDERIVLYYILHENVRKVSKSTISSWLNKCEIRGVKVDNAFDLLSSFDNEAVNNDTLEFGIDTFRKYSANAAQILPPLKKCVDQHIELAVNTFQKIWSDDTLDINIRLFIAYIVEERMRTFGDRWMAEGEIENIRQWEGKNTLDSTLSNNYGSCLEFFIQNELVYASSWTSYGNPREYTLFPSLQELLFNCPHKIMEELQKVKDAYHLDLPF